MRIPNAGSFLKKHGHYGSPTYKSWQAMKNRCNNPGAVNYNKYGGAGVSVCDRWNDSFKSFLSDMGERPDGMSIDRIGYTPGNCRWSTSKQQNNNRRDNRVIEFNGEKRTLAQWGEITGFGWNRIRQRLGAGWTVERALTEAIRVWPSQRAS